jgi:16S rRNA (cytidine1402-2'-O)-methyltransferase
MGILIGMVVFDDLNFDLIFIAVFFKEIQNASRTVVFYESVHRIEKTLASLDAVLSPSRVVVVARELTKLHEEVVRGTASEVKNYFLKKKDHVRGEFVVIVSGGK